MFLPYTYTVATQGLSVREIAKSCFEKVLRMHTEAPGFAWLSLGTSYGSLALRQKMVELKNALDECCQKQFGLPLTYQWLGRFDQQSTTKFHIDHAPDQSFLLLGYEPSHIDSQLLIADYPAYAKARGWSLEHFFEQFNPLQAGSDAELEAFSTRVDGFQKDTYNIVLLNNSNGTAPPHTLGVMHKAVVPHPNKQLPRVINSMMLQMTSKQHAASFSMEEVNTFLSTDSISKAAAD